MLEGLKLLGQGLPIVFLVLAAIFIGTKLLHWFLPNQSNHPIPAKTPSPQNQNLEVSLSEEEVEAIRTAIYHATNSQGMPGKILKITKS